MLNADKSLRDEIWCAYNHYDTEKFRNWEDFEYVIDTSRCKGLPKVERSVITVREKHTGRDIWVFGICLKPEEVFGGFDPEQYDFS